MTLRNGLVAALLAFSLGSAAQQARAGSLDALSFLLGEWKSEGGGTPGEAAGGFTFARSLQDRVVLRTSHADYPAQQGRPASRHDDLMVVYATEAGEIRADFYDSEGHVIRYAGTAAEGSLTLSSDPQAPGPRFRLSYTLGPQGVLAGRFEIAPPGKPEAFSQYLAWTARRVTP